MLLETTLPQEANWLSIIVVLSPIMLPLIRYLIHLGTVQKILQKTHYAEMLTQIVDVSIVMVENWAKAQSKAPLSEDKKQMAIDFVKMQAKKAGIPEKLMDDMMVSASIESALSK